MGTYKTSPPVLYTEEERKEIIAAAVDKSLDNMERLYNSNPPIPTNKQSPIRIGGYRFKQNKRK